MKGLSIDFKKTGATLAVASSVTGFATVAQNGMVNIATSRGSDKVYPSRGTALYAQGVLGDLTTYKSAYHASNFAALDTLLFALDSNYEDDTDERLKSVKLLPVTYTGTTMRAQATFIGVDGTRIGKETE